VPDVVIGLPEIDRNAGTVIATLVTVPDPPPPEAEIVILEPAGVIVIFEPATSVKAPDKELRLSTPGSPERTEKLIIAPYNLRRLA
jgi:hypothetical protein